jgi:hypothetical protein
MSTKKLSTVALALAACVATSIGVFAEDTPARVRGTLQKCHLGCRGNPRTRYSSASPDARTVRFAALRGAPVATPFPAGVSRALH